MYVGICMTAQKEIENTAHVEDENYEFPPIDLLSEPKEGQSFDRKAIHARARFSASQC